MIRFSPLALLQAAMSVALVFLTVIAARAEPSAQRIVSVGGAVTEIVYALGQEHRLVARDVTSNHPPAALDLPSVGYIRRLSPEGILSANPDLILAEDGAGPPEAIDLLRAASIPMIEIPGGTTRDAILAKINAVAKALGVPDQGAHLAARVGDQLDAALAGADDLQSRKVLFILSMQGGRIMAAGNNTEAAALIGMAGGENAVTGFEGYKLLTDEALTQSGAEVVLLMDRTGDHGITDDMLFSHPALAVTPAAATRSVVRMDGMYMLGFSVRTADAVRDLAKALQATGS
ncbi:heme/hemin ABC transporter substrate-binding protein [Phaeobacter marinintestinus]|uniref:heme/hemin ABC transporter substrate-binding protein n=1 Tax=Falsiphaeobacter marinintestinus TaxID=1492905 RepID=UPI0011B42A3C|nr:ABC transporter substrate-binding protein [Phaeobacter marinintestinus]